MLDLDTATKSELDDVMAECYKSHKVTAKVLFPERFDLPFSEKIHDPIFEILDDDSIKKAAVAAPRGTGKTSIVSLAAPARNILFRESKYIVPVSCSSTLAEQQSENLKDELLTNPLINKIFGNMKSKDFSKEQWVADNAWDGWRHGTCVMPRGAGQQIRGLLFRGSRPDIILVDDLEDPEKLDSETQRWKKRKWFFADLMKCVARYKKDWRIIVLGTVLHEDSLINRLLEDPAWESVSLELCDENLHSNWQEFMTDDMVRDEYDEAQRQGVIDVFFRENRNIVQSPESAGFHSNQFKYYEEKDFKLNTDPEVINVVLVDPSKTVKMNSAETGIVGIGVNLKTNAIFIRDAVGAKLHPDEVYDETFKMAERINAVAIGVEVTGLEEFITYPFKNEMISRGLNYQFIELKARGGAGGRGEGKKMRVRALVPFYRKGLVYHNRSVCAPLEAQLLSFPRAQRWDLMDAAAYIVEMLEEGLMYFSTVYDEAEEESPDDVEREFRQLEAEYDTPLPIPQVI